MDDMSLEVIHRHMVMHNSEVIRLYLPQEEDFDNYQVVSFSSGMIHREHHMSINQ